MFGKLIIVILAVGATGAALLDLRQRRTETIHQISKCYRQMAQTRYDLWRSRSRVAEQLEPKRLRELIARAQLTLEPVACGSTCNPPPSWPTFAAADRSPGTSDIP